MFGVPCALAIHLYVYEKHISQNIIWIRAQLIRIISYDQDSLHHSQSIHLSFNAILFSVLKRETSKRY